MSIQFTREQVENDDVANRFLKRQLSPEETIAFEEYLMEHPELLEQLQLDEMFIESIGSAEVEQAPKIRTAKSSSPWSSIRLLGLGAIGAYASVALFSLVNTTSTMINIDRVVYVDTVRSFDPVQKHIELGDSNEKMVLMLSAGFDQTGPFDVSIVKEDTSEIVAVFKGVPKTETDDIAVVVGCELFEIGQYLFVVNSSDEGTAETSTLVEFTGGAAIPN